MLRINDCHWQLDYDSSNYTLINFEPLSTTYYTSSERRRYTGISSRNSSISSETSSYFTNTIRCQILSWCLIESLKKGKTVPTALDVITDDAFTTDQMTIFLRSLLTNAVRDKINDIPNTPENKTTGGFRYKTVASPMKLRRCRGQNRERIVINYWFSGNAQVYTNKA